MKTSISERIRLQRLQRGYSQENMADLLSLSTTAYGDIERGKTDLTLSRLTQIAQVLNVSPLVLLTDEAIPTPAVEVAPAEPIAEHELETLRLTIEKQQLEIEKLRLEVDNYKRKYEDRIAFELARALGLGQNLEQSRQRIGF
ncbi:helix-turn-helix domain-containing protein [Fibrisoma montanum]|uniref:Helix-turn-helix domain-containing protein n=1 Tax=Fibrisoma montanum TaxID=2305895 RepID=A0A418MFE6_9BACT|nr:helix-turn-helix domain-containing protein [Fibrisoma montanum]RIV25477.1 helix-turn-helix domain-containing protein [Fibrisoma montanum]